LAAICAQKGFDLLVAADRPEIHPAAERCRTFGAQVTVVETHNTLQSAIANVTPAAILAEQHRKIAEPGSAKKRTK
jgi:hypothetical protein